MSKDSSSSARDRLSVPIETIERRIYLIRGNKVMLAADLADLYLVPAKVLNQAVRRNLDRFQPDSMFQLSKEEAAVLRSQIVTLERVAAVTRNSAAKTSADQPGT
jgi:DNA recombination-dependent growth factor C